MTGVVVELFGGAGGASEGMRRAGIHAIGIEIDPWACATRAAAGHLTIRADVEHRPLEPFRQRGVTGLWASPPCLDWSQAGRGAKREGTSGHLVDIVPVWVEALRPEWIACEQVPPALEVWEEHALLYRAWGYSVWCGILCAADYGVPQTRRRAILMASRVRAVTPPTPTHAEHPAPTLFGATPLPWISMAEALGWGIDTPSRTVAGNRQPRWLYPDVDGTHGRSVVRTENFTGSKAGETWQDRRYERCMSRPAPTIGSRFDQWTLHTNRDPLPDGTRQTVDTDQPAAALTGKSGGQWAFHRPATTVCATDRVGRPGHKDRAGGESQFAEDSIKLTLGDALILQGFPADYPVQGNKTQRFLQIGNAVPPPLAEAIVRELTGQAKEQAA